MYNIKKVWPNAIDTNSSLSEFRLDMQSEAGLGREKSLWYREMLVKNEGR